ncbi:large ribosomal subunit protein P1-like isoform X2 [Saimiri boliviensis]|uniref:large ribosomal subunit protein P1-like isoform X2 n=1 Tax=Saimiri boliviensis TaxID=27679 RepID=UPI000533CE25|nr:60S acidic ribosomal protein P1-like isoform X2 [Saimiri boliviensis boliviensis]
MASVSELSCSLSALMLHDNELTIRALANVNIGSLIYKVGPGGPAPAADAAPAGDPTPSTAAAPAQEKKVETKKEESKESDDDMDFGPFD